MIVEAWPMSGRSPRPAAPLAAHLALPVAAPEPAPGCDVCEALAVQRVEAQGVGDYSKVTDCNVEIRQHPHPGVGS